METDPKSKVRWFGFVWESLAAEEGDKKEREKELFMLRHEPLETH